MKKMFVLVFILIAAAGCNNTKKDEGALSGTWTVYKYLLNNVDQTPLFTNRYIGFKISFTSGGNFTEIYGNNSDTLVGGVEIPDTLKTYISGTYTLTNQDNMLTLTASSYVQGDSVIAAYAGYIQQYTVFDLSTADVQLVTDSSRLYMSKTQ